MTTVTEEVAQGTRTRWMPLVLPIALLVGLVGVLVFANPGAWLDSAAPPAEEIAFERVILREGVIEAHVRNAVSAPVSIGQVTVDDAFWDFTVTPDADLDAFEGAIITIPYPWVELEPHTIGIMTNTGVVWSYDIAVALPTPVPEPASLQKYALIGLLVGVFPIVVGMAFFPAMRQAPARWTNALLAFTMGLLAFLAVDTVSEGLELAEAVPSAFQGLGLFFGAALLALVGVLALERSLRGSKWALALMIAIGIGLHNLGEGLLIGSAFALGSLALGTTLIAGFALHNVTEGPAIVAPLVGRSRKGADASASMPAGIESPRQSAGADASSALARSSTALGVKRFALLAGIAGLPTVLGAWLGAFASYSLLPVIFFGLGAGAILVVLVQVGNAMRREGELMTPLHMAMFGVGYVVMLATSLLTA